MLQGVLCDRAADESVWILRYNFFFLFIQCAISYYI